LPSFIVPKKNENVHFLSDIREVDKRLIKNPFPIPNLSAVLQKIEGFTLQQPLILTWVITPSDWIQMHSKSAQSSSLGAILLQEITNGNSRFFRLFSSKKMELMESLEYVKACIDDLLCISKNSLEDHLKK
jgi:hypothetical protein